MKTQRLQAAFARKREAEHMRTQENTAADRYYSHWNKVTAKYQNWTTPEYYQGAEKKIQELREKKEKEEKLRDRKQKLRQMLLHENISFEEQLAFLKRPRSRNLDVDMMEQIDKDFKAKQEERRRLELEAKLYGRWRTGVNDENLLYESKSTNQALAKLNWLDKQIETQMLREEEEKLAQKRAIRLQKEARRTEEQCKQRQEIRKMEIEEIRTLQEKHMQELRLREQEVEDLKSDANFLENSLEHLNIEIGSLAEKKRARTQERILSHNLRKIKLTIRERSQSFLDELESDLELLNRLNVIYPDEEIINDMIDNLKSQREMEAQNLGRIKNMYESEAKTNLQLCEDTWSRMYEERHIDLSNLLDDLKNTVSHKILENKKRQKQLNDLREIHLSAIENSNERLKMLTKEDVESPRLFESGFPTNGNVKQHEPLERISDSFSKLNLDCSESDLAVIKPESSRSMILTSDRMKRPSFARKKVAWV